MISIIAAIGKNRELGKNNDLIWRISSDLKRFKELTTGHPIIMGRKTFESIGRILPGRKNIVITHDPSYKADGAVVVSSVEQAIKKANSGQGSDEVFIIGGAQIFNLAIKYADRIYLTKINAGDKDADTFFPDYSEFKKIAEREGSEDNGLKFEYLTLEK